MVLFFASFAILTSETENDAAFIGDGIFLKTTLVLDLILKHPLISAPLISVELFY